MDREISCNIVYTLYFLYFENKELVYHFERVWTKDGMRYTDDEYVYVFCGMGNKNFDVDLETYFFLCENNIIEETSGNEYESIYILTEYHRVYLTTILKERKERTNVNYLKTVAK